MSDAATSMSLSEIGYNIIIIIVFLVFFSAIIFMSNPDRIHATVASKEISYIASQVSGTNVGVAIRYDKVSEVNTQSNQISVKAGKMSEGTVTTYIGKPVRVSAEDGTIRINTR